MSLDMFFKPRSIAIIGATNQPLSIPHRIVTNLMDYGFKGPIYPVHPRNPYVKNIPAFKTILDVPGEVDLAHIIVRNNLVPDVVRDCGKKGVKGVIVNASGFREVGPEGAAIEEELKRAGREAGVRIWGPNCQGCMNSDPEHSLYANFTFARMRPGHISICAQGGGVAELINNHLAETGIGFRMYASNGNACDVSIPEIIEYWNEDAGTRCIVLHVESFSDPADFLRVASKVTKPILAIKSGTTEQGARAVASHTGGLMEQDTVTDLVFEKAGVLRFRTAQELCEAAMAFATAKPPRGKRVAMLTNTGSLAIMAADEGVPLGIDMPDPAEATRERLRTSLQGIASLHNPVDMMATAGAAEFGAAASALLEDDSFDLLLITMVTPFFVDTEAVAREIARVAKEHDKPLLMEVLTNARWASTLEVLKVAGIPTYYFPESAARAVSALCRYAEMRARPAGELRPIAVDGKRAAEALRRAGPGGWLPGGDASLLCSAYGIPIVEERRVSTAEEVASAAAAVGYPVVVKAEAPDLVHKSDAGAVEVGVGDESALRKAMDRIATRLKGRKIASYLVQKMVKGGVELLVGAARAGTVGHSVAFGLGGIHVEVLRDVRFGLAPLTDLEAERLVRSIRGLPLLQGARGLPKVPLASVVDLVQRVGQLVTDHPTIAELDLNPVLATADGVTVVDARVRLDTP